RRISAISFLYRAIGVDEAVAESAAAASGRWAAHVRAGGSPGERRQWPQSVTGAFLAADLVPDVVLAHRLAHRQAFHFLQGLGVEHDHRALVLPQAGQRVAAVAGELDVRQSLAGLTGNLPDHL